MIKLMAELQPYIGSQLISCIDELETIAIKHGLVINIIDPQINTGSIDNEADRLNVRTDENSVITSFSIG